MPEFLFTVDAALLRELGERLVGQPHIALAELIKNSYDADANNVSVTISKDSITVTDDGDGMSPARFRDYWMRVGSPHKQLVSRTSKNRRMTGSKGIGRLAVQFLGTEMSLRTTALENTIEQMLAEVNWAAATKAMDLTQAKVRYDVSPRLRPYAGQKPHGVEIVIKGLNQAWGKDELKSLAQQVWQLQPPFQQGDDSDFRIVLEHRNKTLQDVFATQMGRNLDLWSARIRARLLPAISGTNARIVRLSIEFAGEEEPEVHEYSPANCSLHTLSFEVRVFSLFNRQKYGIGVEEAREYLREYGGVHIYDGGFHLPYYGPETDWLRTEIDHSHRLSRSKLLPENLQIDSGLNNLPTMSRLYGVVRVDTSLEREMAAKEKSLRLNEFLQIQASRDRLVDNPAYRTLRDIVRYSLDFYAVRQTARMQAIPAQGRVGETVSIKVRNVEEVLKTYKADMPPLVYKALSAKVKEAEEATETEAERTVKHMGLLGALATAGIAAIAYEHEAAKQLSLLEELVHNVQRQMQTDAGRELARRLKSWISSARETRALFAPLNDVENRETRARLRAAPLLEEIKNHLRPLLKGVQIDLDVDVQLRMPLGTVAEWSAIFQNVFINAANATLDSGIRKIVAQSHESGTKHSIRVQDTGSGIDLKDAQLLFQPFVRRLEISKERREMGLGGMGMGLAIVRMVANNLGCQVKFAEPSEGFASAFEISWRDS